jgi:uncharacterized protein RhaS with RHS repeats
VIGLLFLNARNYDPSIGRYTQPDPLGFVDGPSVYEYARGNPQSLVDRSGRVVPIVLRYVGGIFVGPGGNIGYQLTQNGGHWECLNLADTFWRGVGGAGIIGPHWWFSWNVRWGGVRLYKTGPGLDWHRLKQKHTSKWMNRPHVERGGKYWRH